MMKIFCLFVFASMLLFAGEPAFETSSNELMILEQQPEAIRTEEIVLNEIFDGSISTPTLVMPEIPTPTLETPLGKSKKNPFIASTLSAFLPGLGHYYLGDMRMGNELLGGTTIGLAGLALTRYDSTLFMTNFFTVQAVGLYSIFSAYRDAKIYNGDALPLIPRDSFKDLSVAPFQWSVIKKPEVWGGFLGALALGATVAYFSVPESAAIRHQTKYIAPLTALPIALGEEALFRGFLQSALYEKMPAWGAIALSSIAFGAAHIPNAQNFPAPNRWRYYAYGLPLITGLGSYFGWMTYKNRSLKESVALHMWYDFTLFALSLLASEASIGGDPHLFYNFDF